ncbi:uncharacterized protein TrAtP1_002943 [Trichoderma atroviride]|uniref:uncharacterized protein n=1 Tax=Hypocrea atroviridis TaxID=63577 RepID=UPI0033172055|nr:hypothetical protein TrAtP1_002943 [Trichoderma atroviride]
MRDYKRSLHRLPYFVMDNVTPFFTLIAKSFKDDYVVLPRHYGLCSHWTTTKPLPVGYNATKEKEVLKEWGGLDWNEDERVERVYICYVVSKEVRREILTKVLVIADQLAKAGDPQARSYPIDYYIKQ